MKTKKHIWGFTLVELIVVITILAILGTISFISFQGYSKGARDSVRISDLQNIKTSLELFQTTTGEYPEPSNGVGLEFIGTELINQGTFGESTFTNVGKLNKVPKDPLSDTEYTYSLSYLKNEYNIGSVYESYEISSNLLNDTYAGNVKATGMIKGNYNGMFLKATIGGDLYTLALPSLITNDLSNVDIQSIVDNYNLVVNGEANLPESYKNSNFNTVATVPLNVVNSNKLVIFSGSVEDLSTIENQITFIENLQAAYNGTITANTNEVGNILKYDINADQEGTKLLARILIHNYINKEVEINGANNGESETTNIDIGAGYFHSCALLADETVKCWGYNNNGELGNGSTLLSLIPVDTGLTGVSELYVGGSSNFAKLSDGKIYGWGSNNQGQIGIDSTDTEIKSPQELTLLSGVDKISVGYNFACALLENKTVKCWGNNTYGQLGIDSTDTRSRVPVEVIGLTGIKKISLGSYHACVILNEDNLKCWGSNTKGQVGNNSYTNVHEPVLLSVNDITSVKDVALGLNHSCAILNDGTVKCWGQDNTAQLGLGSTSSINKLKPKDIVVGLTDTVSLYLGSDYSCAKIIDGTVKCWGTNLYYRLGTDEVSVATSAMTIDSLNGIDKISIFSDHTCVTINNIFKCLGAGTYGKLGSGNQTNSATLVDVNFGE